jgi:hypothetical protein
MATHKNRLYPFFQFASMIMVYTMLVGCGGTSKAELVIIPAAGHEMVAEIPEASIAALRNCLNAPAQ